MFGFKLGAVQHALTGRLLAKTQGANRLVFFLDSSVRNFRFPKAASGCLMP